MPRLNNGNFNAIDNLNHPKIDSPFTIDFLAEILNLCELVTTVLKNR